MKKPRKLRLRRRVTKSYQAMVNPWPRIDAHLDAASLLEYLAQAERTACVLRYLGGFSQRDIAKVMNLDRRAVRRYLESAIAQLKLSARDP